jgi:hypothetical protein
MGPWHMSYSNTEDSLGVLWHEDGQQGHEEVNGITVYGFWPRSAVPAPTLTVDGWPPGTEAAPPYAISDVGWTVWLWDVRVPSWPRKEVWLATVRQTLAQVTQAGATVAWCALDEAYTSPPGLFDPVLMEGFVWAALTSDGAFICHAKLGEPCVRLDSNELSKLHAIVMRSLGSAPYAMSTPSA